MHIVFDIETNGLYYEATTIHCIAIKIEDGDTCVYTARPIKGSSGSIEQGLEILKAHKAHTLVGHNIINFDLPVLNKLYGFEHKGKLLDTLLVSKLKYTNLVLIDSNNSKLPHKLRGSHSLKAWGYRLGNYKEVHEDWSQLSEEMVHYCKQDVEVNYTLLQRMLLRGLPPQQAIDLEQDFATIIARQEHYGWQFDVKKAQELHVELLRDKDIAYTELLEVFKPIRTWFTKAYPKVAYKKDGTKSQVLMTQEANGCHYNDDMEWGYWEDIEFNPGSVQHRVKFIEHYFGNINWDRNESGNPKTGEADLIKLFEDKDFAKPLVNYLNICKLLGQLAEGKNAWLKLVHSDGRLHGYVDTLGAVSRRCTHNSPNMAQVPSSRAYKGHECRSLFTVGKGKKLIGCDADGLELRTLAHYMAKYDGGDYSETVDKGDKDKGTDIHTVNQKAAGLPTRDAAKTFVYAFLYGAGDGKIGEIVKGTAKEGKALKAKFFKQLPAIRSLVEGVSKAVEKNGTLKALDGNPYYIRSPHSALNTLLQGAGALCMKYWLIEADKALSLKFTNSYNSDKPQYEWVGNIHDEGQLEVDEDIAEEASFILCNAFETVTKLLNFRIPLRGSAAIGLNWGDTH